MPNPSILIPFTRADSPRLKARKPKFQMSALWQRGLWTFPVVLHGRNTSCLVTAIPRDGNMVQEMKRANQRGVESGLNHAFKIRIHHSPNDVFCLSHRWR